MTHHLLKIQLKYKSRSRPDASARFAATAPPVRSARGTARLRRAASLPAARRPSRPSLLFQIICHKNTSTSFDIK